MLYPVHRELPRKLHLIWFVSEPASPADAVSAGWGRGSSDALCWMPAGFSALLKAQLRCSHFQQYPTILA